MLLKKLFVKFEWIFPLKGENRNEKYPSKMNRMKKIYLLIPIVGFMISCSGEKKQTDKSTEALQNQIEGIEESTQKLDGSIMSLEKEMEKSQSEVDSLLNNL